MQRGQATAEYVGIVLACAALLAGVSLAIGPIDGRLIVRAFAGRAHLTPDQRALRSPELRAIIDRAVPRLVLERDAYGDDDEIPVWTSCRRPRCARFPGADPVLYVHVVHAAAGPVIELWTYYPDSRTTHLPIAALRGFHHDDWEGLIVRIDEDGTLVARASAHGGFTGTAPWWDSRSDDWVAYGGTVYRASGSHALGFRRDDIDVARDRWNGDLAAIDPGAFRLVAADLAARRGELFDAETTPPWQKAAWRNPGSATTGRAGTAEGSATAAARAWARAAAVLERD